MPTAVGFLLVSACTSRFEFPLTELQMALFQCHSMKRARRQIQRWIVGRVRAGSAQLGVSRRGRLFVVCAFGCWAASAPGFRSGFCAGSRLLVVRLVGPSVRVGRNARARLCGGGGSGGGAQRGGRLFVFLAPRARCWRGLRLGSSSFFRGRCEPRTPGVGPVGLPVGGWGFCVETAL